MYKQVASTSETILIESDAPRCYGSGMETAWRGCVAAYRDSDGVGSRRYVVQRKEWSSSTELKDGLTNYFVVVCVEK